jgi:para-nitrobenzyl esterase
VANSIGQPGAQHASDIPFFFDTERVKYGDKTTDRDRAMGRAISAYIVNFAKTGDPNGSGLPSWPHYTPSKDELMNFAEDGTAVAGKDPVAGAFRVIAGVVRVPKRPAAAAPPAGK